MARNDSSKNALSRNALFRSALSRNDSVTANLMLSVALFVGLMSFFIVLNAFSSNSQERLAVAMQSIDSAFGFVGQGRSVADYAGQEAAYAGNMEVAAAAALRSVLPDLGFESFDGGAGHIMQVDVPITDWQAKFRSLRLRLADLMTYENPDGRYVLHMMALNGEAGVRIVVGAAARIEAEGVSANNITVGYADRGQEIIRLQFIERREVGAAETKATGAEAPGDGQSANGQVGGGT